MTLSEVEGILGKPGEEYRGGTAIGERGNPVKGDRIFTWDLEGNEILIGFKHGKVSDKQIIVPSL